MKIVPNYLKSVEAAPKVNNSLRLQVTNWKRTMLHFFIGPKKTLPDTNLGDRRTWEGNEEKIHFWNGITSGARNR